MITEITNSHWAAGQGSDGAAAAPPRGRHPLPPAARDLQPRRRGRGRRLADPQAHRHPGVQRPHDLDGRSRRPRQEARRRDDQAVGTFRPGARAPGRPDPAARQRGSRLDRAPGRDRRRQRHPDLFPRRHQSGAAAMVSFARQPRVRIPDHDRDGPGGCARGRRHRARRAQCRARRQSHRLDQGRRLGGGRALLDPGVGLLLSGAVARRLPSRLGRRGAAGAGLAPDLGSACRRRWARRSRPHRDRRPCRRATTWLRAGT